MGNFELFVGTQFGGELRTYILTQDDASMALALLRCEDVDEPDMQLVSSVVLDLVNGFLKQAHKAVEAIEKADYQPGQGHQMYLDFLIKTLDLAHRTATILRDEMAVHGGEVSQ
jgi:hypothetical protein